MDAEAVNRVAVGSVPGEILAEETADLYNDGQSISGLTI